MKKLALGLVGAAVVVSTVAATRMGGWAVVSVEQMPEYIVAGKPVALTFAVRQHAVSPLGGLSPTIVAASRSKRVEGRAWAMPTTGSYRASVTVPEPGDWQITIHSGFGKSKAVLLPVRAVDSTKQARPPIAFTEPERGRVLFAAKGCVSCHVHRDVDVEPELKGFGPELSDKRFAQQYLAQFLADPSIKPPAANRQPMPNPVLKQQEIASLIAFINSERRVTSR